MRKLTSFVAALALAATAVAPSAAQAHDRRHDDRGYYNEGYYDGYDHRRRHRRDRDDHDDAVAAGVIGLVLGLALGAAASQPDEPQARCYDNYQRCEPPRGARQGGYDPRYDDESAYGRDYGPATRSQCMRSERQWDRYARRYVTVDVPC